MDLYPVFMRTQMSQKEWPKKDHKFNIFEDNSEAEIEIEGCKNVIDFTRCSYSVQGNNLIHILVENNESKIQLV